MTDQTKELKTADEILDEELSANMIEHIEKVPQLKEWIKDAMYSFAQQNNQTKQYLIAKLESDLAIEKAKEEILFSLIKIPNTDKLVIGNSIILLHATINEIERQLKELRK